MWCDEDARRPLFISKVCRPLQIQTILDLWKRHIICFWIQDETTQKVIHEWGQAASSYDSFVTLTGRLQGVERIGRNSEPDERATSTMIVPGRSGLLQDIKVELVNFGLRPEWRV